MGRKKKICNRFFSSTSNVAILCCFSATASESFVTSLLPAGDHPGHVDVVGGEGLPGLLHGGVRQAPGAAQDPGEVHMEEPEDVGAGVHQGKVHVVSGQDPVRGVREDYIE